MRFGFLYTEMRMLLAALRAFTEDGFAFYFQGVDDGHNDGIYWGVFGDIGLARGGTRAGEYQIANTRIDRIHSYEWLALRRAVFIRLADNQ